jgi:hypothetical protein
MQQRRKVLILASTRKKHKEGIIWVEDKREEKANDNSKTKIMDKNSGHSTRRFGKSLSLPLILYYTEKLLCVLV